MSPITKTIVESRNLLKELPRRTENGCWYVELGSAESHLLQSQIRLIEAAIEEMRKEKITCEESHGEYGWLCGSCKDVRAYNQALEDQISTLKQVIEELKNN